MTDTADLFRDSAEDAKRLFGEVIPSAERGKRMFTYRVPVGVWAAITPWNFPLMIMTEFLAPGAGDGQRGRLQAARHHAARVPAPRRAADRGGRAGRGSVSILPGDGPLGEQLVTHPGIDAIGFVGSSATAERIVRAAGLKRSIMEASGNGPVIVCADADVERAAEAAAYGAYWNAGQVCCATERVLVDRSRHDDFMVALEEAAKAAVLGDPFDAATTLGPLNNAPTADKMDRHVEDAVQRGAKLLRGGRASGFPTDLYYDLTVLEGVTEEMLVAREESFGPVVPVVGASSDAELLRIANADPLGLQAAVFTTSLKRAFRFSESLRCGSVVVNDSTDYFEAAQPFGGAAGTRTGWGRVGGLSQLRDMTDLRCTIISLD